MLRSTGCNSSRSPARPLLLPNRWSQNTKTWPWLLLVSRSGAAHPWLAPKPWP